MKDYRVTPREMPAGTAPTALKLSQRFAWGFEILRKTWGRQAALLLLMVAVMVGGEFLITFGFGVSGASLMPENPMAFMPALQSPLFLLAVLVVHSVAAIAMFWYQATLIQAVATFMQDGDAGELPRLLLGSVRRTPELITAIGLLLLALFIAFGVLSLGSSALFLPEYPEIVALFTLLSLVILTFFLVGFALVGPVAVLESIGPWAALRRAWGLSRGRRWRILGNFLVLALGLILGSLGVQILMLPMGFFAALLGGLGGVVSLLISLALFFALYLLAMFLLNFMACAFYFEARVVSERWAPPWIMAPDPSWPISEGMAEQATGRGVRAWLELLGYTIAAFVLLLVGLGFLTAKMMELQPAAQAPTFELGRMRMHQSPGENRRPD